MNRYIGSIRKPVRRLRAEQYLLMTLLSFAGSVSLTRLFLEITGYPQLGGGGLHIAHLLWGGLLLFISSLLPLIYSNRWVYNLGAVLAGIGVGLFIDEVGKFITQNNNYFYPPAAPIIYAFFLITIFVYLRVRKFTTNNPRTELYLALESLEEVLDHDLDADERAEIVKRLQYVAQQEEQTDFSRLAKELLHFLNRKRIYIAPEFPGFIEKIQIKIQELEKRYMNSNRARIILLCGVGALGLISLYRLVQFFLVLLLPTYQVNTLSLLLNKGLLDNSSGFSWYLIRLALEGLVGLLMCVAAIFIGIRKEKLGITLSFYGLLLSIATVDLFIFYFDQFSSIIMAIVQFLVLLGLIHYRRAYSQSGNESSESSSSATNNT